MCSSNASQHQRWTHVNGEYISYPRLSEDTVDIADESAYAVLRIEVTGRPRLGAA